MKNNNLFKIITAIIVYILFYLLIIQLKDPHAGNYLGDPGVYIMDEARITESLSVYKLHIYIIIMILSVSLVRFLWLLKNKQLDIFAIITIIWGSCMISTYHASIYNLSILDQKNYSLMLVKDQNYYGNFMMVIMMINLIAYSFGFILYRFIEKQIEKRIFKNSNKGLT